MRVTRAKRALVGTAAGAMVLGLLPAGAAFADTVEFDDVCEGADATFPDSGSTHAAAISCMADYEVVLGLPDGTFGTQTDVRRQQFASMVARFAVAADPELDIPGEEDPFTDVPSSTHGPNVNALWNLDIIEGTSATTFSPNGTLNRGAAATIVFNAHAALGNDLAASSETDFADLGETHGAAVRALDAAGIVEGKTTTNYGYSDPITRGQIVQLLARSAQVLDDAGLWGSTLVEVETNQTFAVSPADFALSGATDDAAETSRTYEVAGFGDVDEVTIELAESSDLTVTNGIVTFEADDDDNADFSDTGATLTGVRVDGVTFTGVNFGDQVAVDSDSVVTFTVSQDGIESVVPVVYEGDDDLALDDDGAPEDGFGIGGDVFFVDPEIDATANLTAVIGSDATVSVQVDDGGGNDLAVAGIPIDVRVSDRAFGDYDDVTIGALLESATISTNADGEAEFTFSADDVDNDTDRFVYAKWTGAGALAGLTSYDDVTVTWIESDGVAETIEVESSSVYNGVSSRVTLTSTVEDAAGVGVAGVDVDFDVDAETRGDFSTTRTTNADGVATFAYTNNAGADADVVNVTAVDDDGDALENVAGADITAETDVLWFAKAADNANFTLATILAVDAEAGILFLDVDAGAAAVDALVWVDYTDADAYAINTSASSFSAWVNRLLGTDGANIEADGTYDGGDAFTSTARGDNTNDTVYSLIG